MTDYDVISIDPGTDLGICLTQVRSYKAEVVWAEVIQCPSSKGGEVRLDETAAVLSAALKGRLDALKTSWDIDIHFGGPLYISVEELPFTARAGHTTNNVRPSFLGGYAAGYIAERLSPYYHKIHVAQVPVSVWQPALLGTKLPKATRKPRSKMRAMASIGGRFNITTTSKSGTRTCPAGKVHNACDAVNIGEMAIVWLRRREM